MTDQTPVRASTAAAPALPDAQAVTAVRRWTDSLFSFRITRPRSLRFRSGEFVMIGLPGEDGRPILRAYSIASPAWDEELEFYSIIVPDGPLTSRLRHVRTGDPVILRPKPVGTLVLDALRSGRRLWLLATGTGVAPFASLLRDPQVWERFETVVLAHTCREAPDLAYGRAVVDGLAEHELLGDLARGKLLYYPTTTRGPSAKWGRITHLLALGEAARDLGLSPLDPEADRAMVCGSFAFNRDAKALLEAAGLREGANSAPAEFVVEKAFVG